MSSDTIAKLAAITDAGKFERIASAVLRFCSPAVYGNISHQGVNTDGKTVKAPLDNIGWVHAPAGEMVVCAAHTTCKARDLEGKWLHDPSTVTVRTRGGKPTQPAGDLIKAIEEIGKLRNERAGLLATFALTSNREEPPDARVKAEKLANDNNVNLDVWSVSRIADFLDFTPDGQAIRFAYLGTPVTRISHSELLRVGQLSVDRSCQEIEEPLLVRRRLPSSNGHVFLSGTSGMGKTTVCLHELLCALAEGQPSLVLDAQTVMQATSIEEAVDFELRRHVPSLEANAGTRALELCTEARPLVVLVEDVNRALNTDQVLNRLATWTLKTKNSSKWRLLCPVWPRHLAMLERAKEVQEASMVQILGTYTNGQAQEAVQRRSTEQGQKLDDVTASAVAMALGNDPLLIGLCDFRATQSTHDVIGSYINVELTRTAVSGSLTATDLVDAMHKLGRLMLKRHNLQPSWSDVSDWFDEGVTLGALRKIVKQGRIFRLIDGASGEIVQARHDRVLYHLLAQSIAPVINTGEDCAYLSDPYFAEIIGTAASMINIGLPRLQELADANPLVAFYAFKHAAATGTGYVKTASRAIEDWVSKDEHKSEHYWSRRHFGLMVLAEVDSQEVLSATQPFPKDNWRQPYFEARFRNGDLLAGLDWLAEYPFDVLIAGRQELVDHVRSNFNDVLLVRLQEVLHDPAATQQTVLGALLLAGYVADPALGAAVRAAWQRILPEERDLEAFLWASARVCGDLAKETLGPVCDAWEALPETEDQFGHTPRNSLAAHGISWKFRDHVPRRALPYFVERAKQSDALRWPIVYMLRGVDDPVALQCLVEYLAQRTREHPDSMVDHFLTDEWQRNTGDGKKFMSAESKQRLLELSEDQANEDHLRKKAFKIWELSVGSGDVAIARSVAKNDVRYESAIWARARRQDLTVVPDLLARIKNNPSYWWQAGRYLWSSELTKALADTVAEIAGGADSENEHNALWIVPELLLNLAPEIAESLLVPVWSDVRHRKYFLQTAICVATPKMLQLSRIALADASDPANLLEHFSLTARWRAGGETKITRHEQLEVLRPYFGFFSDMELESLWDVCAQRGWHEYGKQHVLSILRSRDTATAKRVLKIDPVDVTDLDKEMAVKRWGAYHWMEDGLRNGATRGELVAALLQWLLSKMTVAALDVASDSVSRDWTRAEYMQLRSVAAAIPGADPLLAQMEFNVFHRTLI